MVISMQLDKKNFEKYAFDNYRNAIADKAEFKEDLRKAQHARKLATKIVNGKDVNIRLLVNHVILFFNVFAPVAAKELLLFHSNEQYGIQTQIPKGQEFTGFIHQKLAKSCLLPGKLSATPEREPCSAIETPRSRPQLIPGLRR